jgi:hypothetical protein
MIAVGNAVGTGAGMDNATRTIRTTVRSIPVAGGTDPGRAL